MAIFSCAVYGFSHVFSFFIDRIVFLETEEDLLKGLLFFKLNKLLKMAYLIIYSLHNHVDISVLLKK